jgi:hypothetical protein
VTVPMHAGQRDVYRKNPKNKHTKTRARELVGRGRAHLLFLVFFFYIYQMQHADCGHRGYARLVLRLAAHDAELPVHDAHTVRELKTRTQRLPQARYVTAPNDSMDRDRPRLPYDTMQYTKTKIT